MSPRGPDLIARNFDHGSGAFFDGGSCSGAAICPIHSQDGNSLAILAGVTSNVSVGPPHPGEMAESILAYLSRNMARP